MEPEIRPIKEEELEEYTRIIRIAYGLPSEFSMNMRPEWTLCAFADSRLATTYAAWPLILQFMNVRIPVAGVTWVSTHPAYRRRNYLRKVKEAHFRLLYERREYPLAALNASMAAIYHRYGYGVVTTRNAYSVEPQHLRFALGNPAVGDFREADDGDMEIMLDLYHRFASQRIGCLRRGKSMQVAPGAVFTVLTSVPPAQPPVKLIYRESGQALGYLIFSSSHDPDSRNHLEQRISIQDLVWLSPAAYRAAWDLLARLDLANRIEWRRAPSDDLLPHLLLEPRKLNMTSGDGLMARIVDVERILPLRPYAGEGILTFEILDDLCSWNRGKWKLTASKDGNDICRTDEGPQMVMPISTLVMLLFGQISPSMAAEMGRLDVNDPKALPLWDNVMQTHYRPFCADLF